MKKENLITALKEIMEKETEILFAYLYGSYAHNVIHSRSDIDFETMVMNRFFELKPYLDEYNRMLLQRIKAGV